MMGLNKMEVYVYVRMRACVRARARTHVHTHTHIWRSAGVESHKERQDGAVPLDRGSR